MESSKIDVGDIVALLSKSIESSKVSQLSITKQSKHYCTTMLQPNYIEFSLDYLRMHFTVKSSLLCWFGLILIKINATFYLYYRKFSFF
jgi:hypothetical protein